MQRGSGHDGRAQHAVVARLLEGLGGQADVAALHVGLRGLRVLLLLHVDRGGRVVVADGELKVARGSGDFLPCALPSAAKPLGRLAPEVDPRRNFGAELLG